MRCPFCRHPDSRVVDSREAEEGAVIRRRRACSSCGRRFTTLEEASLRVIKRSGVAEPFSRTKVIDGVRKACQGRPVRQHDLALLAQRVEDVLRSSGAAEVGSEQIGKAILGPLKELDEVAYLRFASVYLAFDSLADFETAIAALRASPARPIENPEKPAGGDLATGRLASADLASADLASADLAAADVVPADCAPADLVAGDLAGADAGRGTGAGGVKTG